MNSLQIAKQKLLETNATCAVIKDGQVYTSELNGIRPALSWLENSNDFLENSYVADRTIGKAAAMLFVYGKVKAVHANLISTHAIEVLKKHEIEFTYDKEVDYIINRTKDDMCPMEKCVLNIDDPKKAYEAIKENLKRLASLNQNK